MLERSPAADVPRTRLDALYAERDPQEHLRRLDREAGPDREPESAPAPDRVARAADRLGGRLTERWVPGGGRTVGSLRGFLRTHRALALGTGAAAVAGVLIVLGLRSAAPGVEAPPPLPAAAVATMPPTTTARADAPLVVSVVGKVARAGLVTLAPGARVADAIAAAGGGDPGVPLTAVNLARKLHDGEQIYVGVPRPATAPAPDAPAAAPGGGAPTGKVDLNTANAAQLDTLPGIGPATAKKILQWRQKHGRFHSVHQLLDVRGIGDATLNDVKDLVTVG